MKNLDADDFLENSIPGFDDLDLAKSWLPPGELTVEKLGTLAPTVWLADAINLMAFGRETPPPEAEGDGIPNFHNIAQRISAANALLNAGLEGRVILRGSREKGGDANDPIDKNYFCTSRTLGREDNTIETDQRTIRDDDTLEAVWQGKHVKWWNVSVDRASFVAWLTNVLRVGPIQPKAKVGCQDLIGSKKKSKLENIVEWLKKEFPVRSSHSNKELMGLIKNKAPHIGDFKIRTLESAINLAYRSGANRK
jgi:hypothetical protein